MPDRIQLAAASVAITLASTLLLSGTARAQARTLTWTETTQVEVPGALGAILRLTGATDPLESSHTMHLQGRALIQEDGESTIVMDLDAGRWMMIDHGQQLYTTFTFEEMAQMTEEALRETVTAVTEDPEVVAAREELDQAMRESRTTLDLRVSSESTGQRQRIGSYNATQHFITTEFVATSMPEGVEQEEGGTIVFLAELWQTTEVPSANDLMEEWARAVSADQRLRGAARDVTAAAYSSEDVAASLARWNPQIGAGILQMAEAIQELTGTPVRNSLTVAVVPLGARLDRAAIAAWNPASMGDQLRAEASGAARQAVGDAARGAVRGLLGGRSAPPPPPPAAAPTVQPLFRITTTRENIQYNQSGGDVLGQLNARIASYRQQTLQDLMTPAAR